MERYRRPAPDVEQALSSMLWTPYERTPTDSSDDEPPATATVAKPACHPIGASLRSHAQVGGGQLCTTNTADTHSYTAPIRYLQQRWHHLCAPSTASTSSMHQRRRMEEAEPPSLLAAYQLVERQHRRASEQSLSSTNNKPPTEASSIFVISSDQAHSDGDHGTTTTQPYRTLMADDNLCMDNFCQYQEVSLEFGSL